MDPTEPYHVLAGTGSRSLQTADLAAKQAAKRKVNDLVAAAAQLHGSRLVVMSGMAEGFDKLLAVVALEQQLPLWCAIPNRGYEVCLILPRRWAWK